MAASELALGPTLVAGVGFAWEQQSANRSCPRLLYTDVDFCCEGVDAGGSLPSSQFQQRLDKQPVSAGKVMIMVVTA